ncbi:PP2C family serine/threonine-protein phosphatase [Streptomyces vietnamensis]|uniref:PP2C family serine/threonine-protein phosphatase n=1 Tax=Streptomyces vietnamensis TaxID=362257 RepID=UPI00379C150A
MRPADGPPPAWRVHGTSAIGYRHLRERMPCQDAWRMRRTPSGLVLAVADGAGSAPRSEEGAKQAVRLATRAFEPLVTPWERLPDAHARKEALTEAFGEVRAAFLEWCGGNPGPYATTLTVVVLAPGWLGQLSVGDGLVVVRSDVGDPAHPAYDLLPRAHTGSEYANETVFVGSPTALRHLRVDCVRDDGIDGVLLSTDGLTQALLRRAPAGRPPMPHDAFLGHLFDRLARPDYDHDEEERQLSEFLGSDQITRVTGDDKTLLWAIRT